MPNIRTKGGNHQRCVGPHNFGVFDVDGSFQFSIAFEIANRAHATQVRKGTHIAYISHPMSVAALILEAGGSVENACAGLLHDVLEEAGPEYAKEIRTRLGEDVLRLEEGCTDGVPDATGEKEPWAILKERHVAHLKTVPDDVLMVSACDKLHNLRSILCDLKNGEAVFERFSVPKDKTLWCCDTLVTIFEAREAPYSREMREILKALA